METKLGKIHKITDLRKVWHHEFQDFSKWLAENENLSTLSKAIEIDIILQETESSVGDFSVDLYAVEEGTGRKIIIENQLEYTDHDHLGKIITYASGKSAEVIVWIVKKARDEHKQAIEWLNQHTDDNIGFFLVEVELWKIDDSLPAAKFNVVERPNDWAKTMKISDGLSETRKLQLKFWQAFKEYAFSKSEFKKVFSLRKSHPQHWYDLSTGNSSIHIELTVNTQKELLSAGIYIRNNKEIFENFNSYKKEIESEFDNKMRWIVANKDCRILISHEGNIKKEDLWIKQFDWLCEMSLKLKKIIEKYENI